MNADSNTAVAESIQASPMTLTDEIRKFTAEAYERLPADYIPTFRALIERLVSEEFGKNAPKVGEVFPDFALRDDESRLVRASDYWNNRNLILKFYRGGWCPYCHLELAALERHASDLASLNAEVFAIGPEKPSFQRETKRAAAANFKFLWDENNALARRLGIAFDVDDAVKDVYLKLNLDLDSVNGEWVLPVPATLVVNNGIVRICHCDADYMRRQDPVELMAALRGLRGAQRTPA